MIKRVPSTNRRGALRAAAVTALALPVVPALAACDATDTTPRGAARTGSAATTTADDDDALVASVSARIAQARTLATRVAKHDHPHRAWALALATLHQQHLTRLGTSPTVASTDQAATFASLRTTEQALRSALIAASADAASGALAQVLASMAAAIGQRLVSA